MLNFFRVADQNKSDEDQALGRATQTDYIALVKTILTQAEAHISDADKAQALQNAAHFPTLLLPTEALISIKLDEHKASAALIGAPAAAPILPARNQHRKRKSDVDLSQSSAPAPAKKHTVTTAKETSSETAFVAKRRKKARK
jgi:hypothetical protein